MSESENNQGSGIAVGTTAQSWTENRAATGARANGWLSRSWLSWLPFLSPDARHLIPFSKTPFLLGFGWRSLWLRKVSLRSNGLSCYRSWKVTPGMGIAAES